MKHLIITSVLFLFCNTFAFAQQETTSLKSLFSKNQDEPTRYFRMMYSPDLVMSAKGSNLTYDDYQTFSIGILKDYPAKDSDLSIMTESGFVLGLNHYTISSDLQENIVFCKVPFDLVLGINLSHDLAIYPYVGGFARLNIFGRETYNNNNSNQSLNLLSRDDMGDSFMKRVALGYQAGARVRFGKYFAIVEYESSITNLIADAKYHYTSYGIGIAF